MAEQEPNTTVSCSGCGTSVPEPRRIEDREPCPTCGSMARTFAVTLADKAEVRDGLAYKARHGDVGKVKPYLEAYSGSDYYRDSEEWRQVARVVDRENDRYTERIVDAAGNVVRDVDESLREHRGRGAAKRRRPEEPLASCRTEWVIALATVGFLAEVAGVGLIVLDIRDSRRQGRRIVERGQRHRIEQVVEYEQPPPMSAVGGQQPSLDERIALLEDRLRS